MNDWIEWNGGVCPLLPETQVEVELRDGDHLQCSAWNLGWKHDAHPDSRDIVRYRIAAKKLADGWIEWHGGECPVPPNVGVEIELRNGETGVRPACCFNWARYSNQYPGDIVRYRVIESEIDPNRVSPHTTVIDEQHAAVDETSEHVASEAFNASVARLKAATKTLEHLGYTYEGGELWKPAIGESPAFKAPDLLDAAAGHMRDRAKTYDKPEGERSMGKTVEAFNVITGRDLRESEGWLLMALLKMVRSETRGEPHEDSISDLVAYSALYGEARMGLK